MVKFRISDVGNIGNIGGQKTKLIITVKKVEFWTIAVIFQQTVGTKSETI